MLREENQFHPLIAPLCVQWIVLSTHTALCEILYNRRIDSMRRVRACNYARTTTPCKAFVLLPISLESLCGFLLLAMFMCVTWSNQAIVWLTLPNVYYYLLIIQFEFNGGENFRHSNINALGVNILKIFYGLIFIRIPTPVWLIHISTILVTATRILCTHICCRYYIWCSFCMFCFACPFVNRKSSPIQSE